MVQEASPISVGSILTALRDLPAWLLAGLAIAGYGILFLPPLAGVDLKDFRDQWGVWVWVATIIFTFLAITRIADIAIRSVQAQRHAAASRRALRLVPRHHQRWWHLAKQQNDTFVSQITLDVEVMNLANDPVRIVRTRIIRPKVRGAILHAEAMLPSEGSPNHSSRHAIPPRDTATASLHFTVRGVLGRQGTPISVTLGITDQFGEEYRLKGIIIDSHDKKLPPKPLRQRATSWWRRLSKDETSKKPDTTPRPGEWDHDGIYNEIDLILKEEQRFYAAKGRAAGGLGSLNIGLQSEPNRGWTTSGQVPTLLWGKDEGVDISSPNLTRLIGCCDRFDPDNRSAAERYLLSHLRRNSPYANVAYLVFLFFHRRDRTIEALREARTNLAGDKVYGYSNLLAALSAVFSHEHHKISPELSAKITEELAGDDEPNFRLIEKINSARLQHLDVKLAE